MIETKYLTARSVHLALPHSLRKESKPRRPRMLVVRPALHLVIPQRRARIPPAPPILDQLGDLQSHYLLEQFVRGDIYHFDTIVYGRPPLEVSHEGGIFTTKILNRDLAITRDLHATNDRVLAHFGLRAKVSPAC